MERKMFRARHRWEEGPILWNTNQLNSQSRSKLSCDTLILDSSIDISSREWSSRTCSVNLLHNEPIDFFPQDDPMDSYLCRSDGFPVNRLSDPIDVDCGVGRHEPLSDRECLQLYCKLPRIPENASFTVIGNYTSWHQKLIVIEYDPERSTRIIRVGFAPFFFVIVSTF